LPRPKGFLMKFILGKLVYPLIYASWKHLPKSFKPYIKSFLGRD
jgi:hypothetical protein